MKAIVLTIALCASCRSEDFTTIKDGQRCFASKDYAFGILMFNVTACKPVEPK